jgi:hypothetical protein
MVLTPGGYGRWGSPLSPVEVASAKMSLAELCSAGTALDGHETRPGGARACRVREGRCHGSEAHDTDRPIGPLTAAHELDVERSPVNRGP